MRQPSITAQHRSRAGLSLLEVLVACGILVVGLSSIAALLPAATSRLIQATQEDRAGIVAANAYAEVLNRGLISSALFSGTVPVVFGKDLRDTGSALLATGSTQSRIDETRGFVLEDELIYAAPTTAETPRNQFKSGTTGPRDYREAICWGAMLSPSSYPARRGGRATLTIVVFKKEGITVTGTLMSTGTGGSTLMRYTTGNTNGVVDEASRKRFLPGCSYVLAETPQPQWLKVTSSWTTPGPTVSGTENVSGRTSYVVLAPNPLVSGSTTLRIIGFENVLRLDQYQVILD
jgi:hypothetical protein